MRRNSHKLLENFLKFRKIGNLHSIFFTTLLIRDSFYRVKRPETRMWDTNLAGKFPKFSNLYQKTRIKDFSSLNSEFSKAFKSGGVHHYEGEGNNTKETNP